MFVSTRANHGIARNRQFKFHKKWSGIRISTTRKKNPPPTKHTKQLFNQEANSLGWFLFTCWLEIPFFLHYQKKHVGISRNFSLKSHYQSSLQTHAHTWKKKPRRQVKTITINSVSYSFHSSVSAAGLYSIRVFQACSQPHQSVCVLPYDSIGATSRSNFRQIVRELK